MSKIEFVKEISGFDKPKETYMGFSSKNFIYPNTIHLLGFRFDGTSCFRKGADQGPDAIRNISEGYETYSPYLDRDLEDRKLVDLGNLPHYPDDWKKTNDHFTDIFRNVDLETYKVRLLTLGGEHSISYGPIRKYLHQYPDLCLLHLDAHADLRDGYQGHVYSHASIMFRVLEYFETGHDLIQYGIRSGTKNEYEIMEKKKSLATSRVDFLERVKALPDNRPLYLTLDLDFFDPAFLPGTGTPEAGGEDFHSFVSLVKILKTKNFVGADVVELAPELDPTGNSACFAAKVVREIALALNLD